MTTDNSSIPKWILIVSALFALMEMIVSFSLYYSPQSVLETVDLNAKGVNYVVQMWAARQFALGFIFAFACIKKSAPMLTLAYIFFLVMLLGDLLIGVVQKEGDLIVGSLVMCLIAIAMIYSINKKKKT